MKSSIFPTFLLFLLFHFITPTLQVVGQIQTAVWKVPDGKLENFSQTFFQGQTLAVSWNGWTQVVGGVLDATKSLTDLWVTAFDSAQNPYNELIKSMATSSTSNTTACIVRRLD